MSARGLLLLALLAPAVRADEALGMQLVREAQARLAEHDAEGALALLDRARTEWPGSDVVACTRGDALLAAGRQDEALAEYERALSGEHGHHARFNRGVAQSAAGEQGLQQAGVPADVAALPEGPQPELLAAVQEGRRRLELARHEFLQALDQQDEPSARESLGALNRRLDALAAIEEELQRRAEPPDPGEDQQPGDQPPPEGEPQPSDQPQDQPPPDQPQDQPPEGQPDQPQEEPAQDQPQEPDEQAQPDESQPQEGEEVPPPEAEPEAAPQPARELSEEEVQRLLDRLAQLEAEARAHAKAREAAGRRAVEKDW